MVSEQLGHLQGAYSCQGIGTIRKELSYKATTLPDTTASDDSVAVEDSDICICIACVACIQMLFVCMYCSYVYGVAVI